MRLKKRTDDDAKSSLTRADNSLRVLVDHTGVGMAEQWWAYKKVFRTVECYWEVCDYKAKSNLLKILQKVFAAKLTSSNYINSTKHTKSEPAPQPKLFFGRSTVDLTEFLSHFERYSNICRWDSKQRLQTLPLCLQGNVGSWYASRKPIFMSTKI